jgi:predicted pyridoxine 5'-phosphate oxidase superfamily flavin-nucleotide-binding protein
LLKTSFGRRTSLTDIAASDLASIYPQPTARVIAKARPEIDVHAKKFIAMSPFCVLATSGTDGSVDASPRGGNPGFVSVAGPKVLLMPDRSGNNRIDSFRNIVEGSGFVQLIFFVPGIDETLRVGGKGKLSADPELLASRQTAARGAAHRRARGLFPLRQGADALKTVVGGDAGRAPGVSEHRRGDPRPDEPRRTGKPGRGRGAVQDAAVRAGEN